MSVCEQCAKARLDRRDRAVLAEHRQREPRAEVRAPFADPVEEAEVLGETAERDVLPVVGGRLGVALALGQRLHGAAQRRPCLEHRYGMARVGEVERRREAGQAPSYDRHLHGRSPFATTASLRGVESRGFSPNTSNPRASIRSSVSRYRPANVPTQSALRRSSDSSRRSPSAR